MDSLARNSLMTDLGLKLYISFLSHCKDTALLKDLQWISHKAQGTFSIHLGDFTELITYILCHYAHFCVSLHTISYTLYII